MQEILEQTNQLLDTVGQSVFRGLSSTSIEKRGEAVNKILRLLDPTSLVDNNIFQAIPIDLLSRWQGTGALYFIETIVRNGHIVAWEVIESIINTIISSRKDCRDHGNTTTPEILTEILHELFATLLDSDHYSKNPKLYMLIWADAEHIDELDGAIDMYSRAIGLGSVDSYMRLAAVYEHQGKYDMSIITLEDGYRFIWGEVYLHRLILALCKDDREDEALMRYRELQKNATGPIASFLVYRWSIKSDDDLLQFESTIVSYQNEQYLIPQPLLVDLAISASLYISNQIEQESSTIEWLNTVADADWSDEQTVVYTDSIVRRLFLMQTHIISLRDSRYLDFYLDEIGRYSIDGTPSNHTMLHLFFQKYFSIDVLSIIMKIPGNENFSNQDGDIFQCTREHLVRISEIFGQGSFYDLIAERISPMIDACLKIEWEYDDEDDIEKYAWLNSLRDESELYISLPLDLQKWYEEYIALIDKTYGMFYRRNIQMLARDSEYSSDIHSGVFEEYPQIALLFSIERILQWNLFAKDEEIDLSKYIQLYHLDQLNLQDALLFASFLFEWEAEYECVIEYLLNIAGILNIPRALYMIIEWLRLIDDGDEKDDALNAIHAIVQEEYGASDFFEHAQHVSTDITQASEVSDTDIQYVLLTTAGIKLFQDKDREALPYLERVSQYGSSIWLRWASDIYQAHWDYDLAITGFLHAYLMDSGVATIRQLIWCYIAAGRFDDAWKYIEIAMRENYDIFGFIFALHLWQWHEKEAIQKMVTMIQSDWQIDMAFPEWWWVLLATTIDYILANPIHSLETDELKVLSSYVGLQFLTDTDSIDTQKVLIHLNEILSMVNSYEWDILHMGIINSIWRIVGDQVEEYEHDDLSSHALLLNIHALNIWVNLNEELKIVRKTQNLEQETLILATIDMLTDTMINILWYLPGGEKYILKWRNYLNFSINREDMHEMAPMLQ